MTSYLMRTYSEIKVGDRIVGHGDVQRVRSFRSHVSVLVESYEGGHLSWHEFDGLVECVKD